MIYMFCADGVEEIEALATLDVLRRAGLEVTTVAVNGNKAVTGPHGIVFFADITLEEFNKSQKDCECAVLPGGGVGTETLANNAYVCDFIKEVYAKQGVVAAICAAPSVLGRLGLLRGKKAVCYPGFEKYLYGAEVLHRKVSVDGNVITARGMGCAVDFGLAIIASLCGAEAAERVGRSIMLF